MVGTKHIKITVIKAAVAAFIFCMAACNSYAQLGSYKASDKATDCYKKAFGYALAKDYKKALIYCEKAKKEDPKYPEPYVLTADIYRISNQEDLQKKEYLDLMKMDSQNTSATLNLASMSFNKGEYFEATKLYKNLLCFPTTTVKQKTFVEDRIEKLKFPIYLMNHPVPFTPINMGDAVNTKYNEFPPSFTVDEETMYFTRWKPLTENQKEKEKLKMNTGQFNEDILFSIKKDGKWQPAMDVPKVNTEMNEGALSVSPDGSFLIFTACNREDGFGSCDLYISVNHDGKWDSPQNMGAPINTNNFESQPRISYDGKTIYFVSNRPGGKGGMDLWSTTRDEDWNFSQPVNLGGKINTAGNEQSPYIHTDNQTLYFSSNGLPGMGAADIFIARKNADGNWDSAVNIGYPINTYTEETGLVVDRKGEFAYYTSGSGPNHIGGNDLYYFTLPKTARPSPVTYLKGKVFDAETKKNLAAVLEIADLSTGKTLIKYTTGNSGSFLIALPEGKDYLLNVKAKGYLFYSDNIPLKNYVQIEPYIHDVPLQPLKAGVKITLKNIFFKTDSYELENASALELNRMIDFLKTNPQIKIEISGHTDNTGQQDHNKTLSENRAKSVYDYLLNTGKIPTTRMKFTGYGDAQPIAENTTEKGKAENRRTELKIIE
ncbi:MAG: OmpA family protein [Bacteroidetes bacterium]|nr:OmpA family protein [Bacteroidota bacterium]